MSAATVLAQHRKLWTDCIASCSGCDWSKFGNITRTDLAHAQHQLDVLNAAGYSVVEPPPERGVEEYLALRYAEDPIEAFNLFIKHWVPQIWHGHLLDDDENDGQFVRDHIANAIAAEDAS